MGLIEVDSRYGPTRIGGRRTHHGFVGALLATVGGVLMWHDRRDARVWLADFLRHPGGRR